jgi:hypothetical protein
MKKCNNCCLEKEDDLFCKKSNLCKTCNNEIRRKKYAENKEYSEKIKAKQRAKNTEIKNFQLVLIGTKYCKYCNVEKNVTLFRPKRLKCTDCERKDGRNYRKSILGKEKSLKWVEENRDKMTKLQSDWYQLKKSILNKKYVERYHNDPIFKLHVTCKSRIRSALEKCKTTNDYIGCDGIFYVMWIEFCLKQENEELTLENHGDVWHIDHVIPIANFDLNDKKQQMICFNWRNTMPLNAKINMSKHNKIIDEQVKKHYNNLISFHKKNKYKIPIEFNKLYAKHLIMTGNPLESKTTINK